MIRNFWVPTMLEGLSNLPKFKQLIHGRVKIQTPIFWLQVPTSSIFFHYPAHTFPHILLFLPHYHCELLPQDFLIRPPPLALCASARRLPTVSPSLPGRSRSAILWGLTWVIWELSPEPLSLRGLASKMLTSLRGNSMDSRAQLSFSRFFFRLQRGEPWVRVCKTGAQGAGSPVIEATVVLCLLQALVPPNGLELIQHFGAEPAKMKSCDPLNRRRELRQQTGWVSTVSWIGSQEESQYSMMPVKLLLFKIWNATHGGSQHQWVGLNHLFIK